MWTVCLQRTSYIYRFRFFVEFSWLIPSSKIDYDIQHQPFPLLSNETLSISISVIFSPPTENQRQTMSQQNTAESTRSKSMTDLAFDESLIQWTVPAADWLRIHNKHFDGISTAAFIFDAQNRVLLVQRAAHDSMPNKWEAPGGAVDPEDVSILHGCAREVREEAGLVARRMKRLVTEGKVEEKDKGSVFTNRTGTKIIYGFGFEVEVEEGGEVVLDANEHQAWVWAEEAEVRAERMGDGRGIALTGMMMRRKLLEAFRLREEEAGEVKH
ncbi:NUDIX hydrolase domain-like protein [Trichoderma austrokoningii]